MRNRRINFERFRRDATPLAARHVRQGAHIVRAVGQFDQDDAHIARHGQQHFAKGLSLVFFARVELQFVQFGQPIDQFGDRRAKPFNQFYLGYAAVFQRVVQQRSHEGLGVELPFSALRCHRNGVGDIGLAVVA